MIGAVPSRGPHADLGAAASSIVKVEGESRSTVLTAVAHPPVAQIVTAMCEAKWASPALANASAIPARAPAWECAAGQAKRNQRASHGRRPVCRSDMACWSRRDFRLHGTLYSDRESRRPCRPGRFHGQRCLSLFKTLCFRLPGFCRSLAIYVDMPMSAAVEKRMHHYMQFPAY